MRTALHSTVIFTLALVVSIVLFMQNRGCSSCIGAAEEMTVISITETPVSAPVEDPDFPEQLPDEESEDEDDHPRGLEKHSWSFINFGSKSLTQLQLIFKEHHREVNTPPPQS